MTTRKLPPVEYLRECFRHDEESGQIIWRERPAHHFKQIGRMAHFNRKYAGQPFGAPWVNPRNGYTFLSGNLSYQGKYYHFICNRLAWLLAHGSIPDGLEVDHANNISTDNRLSNLRLATRSQNESNCKDRTNKQSGLPRGVKKNGSGFMARAHKDGRPVHLGTFKTIEEATAAYLEASRKLHGEFFKHYNSLEPSE